VGDAGLSFQRSPDATLVIRLAGPWRLEDGLPLTDAVERELGSAPRGVTFEAGDLGEWDSALLAFLVRLREHCTARRIPVDDGGLPAGVRKLLALAAAGAGDHTPRSPPPSWVARVGLVATALLAAFVGVLMFVGDVTLAFGRLVRGRARFRRSDLLMMIQQAGADALPIVTLISFLVGVILAFVGAVQLEQFGAAIYVANLVGIAMVREMGAMMTAIVMAGRTGAAYAAQLGSMKANQEIDALATMGISPLDFLVLPRMLALCLMMPLLCLYADFLGILGGAAIGIGMLHLSATLYFQQTFDAVQMSDLVGGLFKAAVYGVLIAIAGCLRGMQAGNSASAVGDATTSAVVTSIVWVISACGIFAVLFYVLGI